MEAQFWLERWREGRTHFHQSRVTPLLQKYWPQLALPAVSTVLVPLCGKSLDMLWLAEQGHKVLGVELSELAVQQFFSENGLQARVHESAQGKHYVAGQIEIICGDIFALSDATLAACAGAYDRAALIALPPEMRGRYAEQVYGRLPAGAQSILITLEYAQEQMDGPPFAVMEDEVLRLYAPLTNAQAIDRRDILEKEPKFIERGLKKLDTVVYRLRREGAVNA
ncbi:thiopurine S-methyltransferase [Herbaspirillum sp. LeCh32-8]|uniref:thiopurine S-methyltransferase n=1 Tax=Herbaspirillum sp. LeCh32-8 TaxID=2821356 RepID=UPI001AE905D0|nr:thiopurine S-methyltransferase [Herbaspirillum sp. LeCh32-8]MBP0600848.1 thiopurine S-methyltransferase [Herbaspirillum sp. LeCh32-8]